MRGWPCRQRLRGPAARVACRTGDLAERNCVGGCHAIDQVARVGRGEDDLAIVAQYAYGNGVEREGSAVADAGCRDTGADGCTVGGVIENQLVNGCICGKGASASTHTKKQNARKDHAKIELGGDRAGARLKG